MSKKRSLILASALMSAGFLASCGGGGGGTTSTPPPPPPSQPPPPSVVGNVMAGMITGITSPGQTIQYREGTVYSDGTITWGNDLLSGSDVILEYYHEFSNDNVALADSGGDDIYLYTPGSGITKTCAGVAYESVYRIFLPHFVIEDDGEDVDWVITSNGKCVDFITTGDEALLYAGENYVIIGNDPTSASRPVYVVKKDGTKTQIDADPDTSGLDNFKAPVYIYDREGDTVLLAAQDAANPSHIFVINDNGDIIPVTNYSNTATGDDPLKNITEGHIRRVGNNVFVAVSADNDGNDFVETVEYFKVIDTGAGSVVFTSTTPVTTQADLGLFSQFGLDGQGHLYLIDNCDGNGDMELREAFINSSNIYATACKNTSGNDDLASYQILPHDNSILMGDGGNFFHYIYSSAQPTNVALKTPVIKAVNACMTAAGYEWDAATNSNRPTDPKYTKAITEMVVGDGTNRIMCALPPTDDDNSDNSMFSWVVTDGNGLYNGGAIDPSYSTTSDAVDTYLISDGNGMVFGGVGITYNVNKVAYCTPGTLTTNGTCTLHNLTKTAFSNVYNKIKSDINVLSDGANYGGYLEGALHNILAAYFTTVINSPYLINLTNGNVNTSLLNVPFTDFSARGGNVKLHTLDKVANVYKPIVNAKCPSDYYDNVWYKDSTNNFNNLPAPPTACLFNVFKVW